METPQPLKNMLGLTIIVFFCVLCVTGPPAFANPDESGSGWRPTYDAIMMCVNFVILVLILVKLLKNPVSDFFKNQRQSITDEIDQLTQQKEKTEAELNEVEKLVAAGDAHIKVIRKKLAEDGEAIKAKIIENARQQSAYMLAAAKKNITNQFIEARQAFQAELIDLAMSSASEKLVNEIDNNDHETLVNQFLYDLEEAQ
jgi:F-type H+-transporting ATPase subunit b